MKIDAGQKSLMRIVFLSIWGALALVVVIAAREVMLPFILALLLAYVLTPLVLRIERLRVPRWIAIISTYAVSLGILWGFGAAIAPRIGAEVNGLRREIPVLIERARVELGPRLRDLKRFETPVTPTEDPEREGAPSAIRVIPGPNGSYDIYVGRGVEVRPIGEGAYRVDQPGRAAEDDGSSFVSTSVGHLLEYGKTNTMQLLRVGQEVIAAVSRAIFVFFITLMLAAYLMLTRERIYEFFRSLCTPATKGAFDHLMARIDRGLSGVVRGQLIICAVNGVLSAIGFSLLGLKYGPILALMAALMSVVPIFGSIMSAIPAVAIGLTQGFGTALAVLAWIVGIHQLEANVLNPKIIGDSAKIHPVLVVFSLVVGEHLFKLPGALLAVPVLSIAQSLFLHFRGVAFGDDAPPDSFRPPPAVATPLPEGGDPPRVA